MHQRSLVLLLAIVVVIVTGCSPGDDEGSPDESVENVVQLVGDWNTARQANDSGAIEMLSTSTLTVTDDIAIAGGGRLGEEFTLSEFQAILDFGHEYVLDYQGDPLVVGDGPWVVAVEEDWSDRHNHLTGIATYLIVRASDGLRVESKHFVGEQIPK